MGKRITIYLDDEMVETYGKLTAMLGGKITVIRYLLESYNSLIPFFHTTKEGKDAGMDQG